MEVYCFATSDKKYVAVQDSPHARILPWDQAFDGSRNVLLYTSNGKARQALGTRNIRSLFPDMKKYQWSGDRHPLASKDDLVLTTLELTLDN